MGNKNLAASNIRDSLKRKDRTYAWLAREAGLPYKRVLAELKHETRPVTLETTLAAAEALGENPVDIIGALRQAGAKVAA